MGSSIMMSIAWGVLSVAWLATPGAVAPAGDDPARLAVVAVDHRPYRVGELVPNVSFAAIDGTHTTLAAYVGGRPLVVAVRDIGCPLSKKYAPRLAALEARFAEQGIRFLFVNPSEVDSLDEMNRDAMSNAFAGAYVRDAGGTLVRALAADRTTDVFLLDAARTLVYRGAIDDQYGLTHSLAAPRREHLVDAINSLLAGEPIRVRATLAPGCVLNHAADGGGTNEPAEPPGDITWHNRISRIMQENCQACHREGGVAPFALETYEQVRGRRGMIEYVIGEGLMPPWHAGPGSHAFENDRSLTSRDREAIQLWIANQCPVGDDQDALLPRRWSTSWAIGEPDHVISIPDPVKVPAEGAVSYKYQWVKTDFAEDRWITAMEIRPTHPEVVHHVLVFLEEPPKEGESRRDIQERWQGGLHGYFAGLVPGQADTHYPAGMAKRLPAGAWLKFQLHYTPNGKAVEDRTQIGFRFAEAPPERELHTSSAMSTRFSIPPGEPNHQVRAARTFREDVVIQSFAPHMHVRGKAYRYELERPDGTRELLLDIPRYDFNWQTRYRLRQPVAVTAGSRLMCTAWFDNSSSNPANPDPTKTVLFGEQTWDEMMIGYFEYWKAE
jgi:thiol-disulfide isomerase/thioredoxin